MSCCRTSPSWCRRTGRGSPRSRSSWTCGPATRCSPSRRCAVPWRAAGSGRGSCSSRHVTRSSSAGTARPAMPIRSATSTGSRARSPRSGACWSRSARKPTSSSTRRTSRCASCASGCSPSSARWPIPDKLAIQLISFGFKYGLPLEADLVFDVRFMQNPYYIAELRQSSGLTEAVKTYVLGQPVAEQFLDVRQVVPGVRAAGLRRRGQEPADDRDRLHRRLPPLDRHRRGTGDLAARAGLRAGRRLPSRAGPGVNLRRWLTPGIGVKRWLLVVFVGLLLAGPRVRPHAPPGDPGPRAGRACSGPSSTP